MWILKKDVVQREEKRLSPPQLKQLMEGGVRAGLKGTRMASLLPPAGSETFRRLKPASTERVQDRQTSEIVCEPVRDRLLGQNLGPVGDHRDPLQTVSQVRTWDLLGTTGTCESPTPRSEPGTCWVPQGPVTDRLSGQNPGPVGDHRDLLQMVSRIRTWDLLGTTGTCESPTPRSEPGTCWGPQGPVTDRLSGQNPGPVGDHRDLLQMVSQIRTRDLLGTTGTCESPTPRSEPGTCWGPQGPVTDRLSGQNPGPVGDHRDLLQMVSRIRTRDLLGTTGTCESPTPGSEPGTVVQLEAGKPLPFFFGYPPPEFLNIPLEEMDPYYQSQKTFVVLSRGNVLHRFHGGPALSLLSASNPLRRAAIVLTLTHSYPLSKTLFSLFILLTILSSCVFMTLSEPPEWSSTVERVFMAIFTFEAVVKVVARGLCAGRFTFLRDGWNWLDVLVICTGYLTQVVNVRIFTVLSSVARVLKIIPVIPGQSQEDCWRSRPISEETRWCHRSDAFFFGLCALIGQHAFMGNLSHKCVVWPPESSDNQSSQYNYSQYDHTKYINDHGMVMQTFTTCPIKGTLCCVETPLMPGTCSYSMSILTYDEGDDDEGDDDEGADDDGNDDDDDDDDDDDVFRACPPGYSCMRTGRNPDYGYTSFDSFSWSLLSVVRLVSKDFWENLMLQLHMTDDEHHMTDDEHHMTDDERHMTDDELHMTDDEHYMTDDERHMTDDEHHMTDDERHMTDYELHMTDEELHMTDDEHYMTDDEHHMTDDEHHMTDDDCEHHMTDDEDDEDDEPHMIDDDFEDHMTDKDGHNNYLCAHATGTLVYFENIWRTVLRSSGKPYLTFFLLVVFPAGFFVLSLIVAVVAMAAGEQQGAAVSESKQREEEFSQILEAIKRSEEEETASRAALSQEPEEEKKDSMEGLEEVQRSCPACCSVTSKVLLKRNCCGCWRGLKQRLQALVRDPLFDLGVVLCLVINTIFMSLEHFPMTEQFSSMLNDVELVFTVIFIVEMLLKLVAFAPNGYFQVSWNIYDSIIVFVSLLLLADIIELRFLLLVSWLPWLVIG
ncbi:hypothetical protein NQZ68_039840 [Dissostichus eleginoides]|nr:hypothetical protein NQZ68_039840 [Dissostichus eleginoides]